MRGGLVHQKIITITAQIYHAFIECFPFEINDPMNEKIQLSMLTFQSGCIIDSQFDCYLRGNFSFQGEKNKMTHFIQMLYLTLNKIEPSWDKTIVSCSTNSYLTEQHLWPSDSQKSNIEMISFNEATEGASREHFSQTVSVEPDMFPIALLQSIHYCVGQWPERTASNFSRKHGCCENTEVPKVIL